MQKRSEHSLQKKKKVIPHWVMKEDCWRLAIKCKRCLCSLANLTEVLLKSVLSYPDGCVRALSVEFQRNLSI